MVLLGTLVNGLAIVIGALLGQCFKRIPERIMETIIQAIAIAVMVLGISMGLKSDNFLLVIIALVVGGLIGEVIDLDKHLNHLGQWLEKKVSPNESGKIAKAFVTASLIYVVGAMAILGALDSGIRLDHSVLYTKALLDGFSAIVFASTLGIGVIFSAVPVLIYQGAIALLATQIALYVPESFLNAYILEMTATGGVMILAIGLNMMGLTKVRVANLLPAILVVGLLVLIAGTGIVN